MYSCTLVFFTHKFQLMSNFVIAGKHPHLSMHSLYKFDIRVGYHKGPTCCLLVAMMCTVVTASWPVSKLTCHHRQFDLRVSWRQCQRVNHIPSWRFTELTSLSAICPLNEMTSVSASCQSLSWLVSELTSPRTSWSIGKLTLAISKLVRQRADTSTGCLWSVKAVYLTTQYNLPLIAAHFLTQNAGFCVIVKHFHECCHLTRSATPPSCSVQLSYYILAICVALQYNVQRTTRLLHLLCI